MVTHIVLVGTAALGNNLAISYKTGHTPALQPCNSTSKYTENPLHRGTRPYTIVWVLMMEIEKILNFLQFGIDKLILICAYNEIKLK